MIHWAFLIPAFLGGFCCGYALVCWGARIGSEVLGAIEEATKNYPSP